MSFKTLEERILLLNTCQYYKVYIGLMKKEGSIVLYDECNTVQDYRAMRKCNSLPFFNPKFSEINDILVLLQLIL